jgi:Zn-finger nucleic acid-binding protein
VVGRFAVVPAIAYRRGHFKADRCPSCKGEVWLTLGRGGQLMMVSADQRPHAPRCVPLQQQRRREAVVA